MVLDRLYCNLSFPREVLKAGGHFLIRYCSNTTFVPDASRPAQETRDADGRRIVQEWGWLGKVAKADRVYVRRITKHLADGKEFGVITDLLDETTYPAVAMLSTYQSRWGLETVFQQITDVFSLKHLIGTQPKAVLFQLSFCLLLYNALQVVRTHLASHQECEAKAISNEKLFGDVERQMVSVSELVEVKTLLSLLGAVPTASEVRTYLRERLRAPGATVGGKRPAPAVAVIRKSRSVCSATIRQPTGFSSKHMSKRRGPLEPEENPELTGRMQRTGVERKAACLHDLERRCGQPNAMEDDRGAAPPRPRSPQVDAQRANLGSS